MGTLGIGPDGAAEARLGAPPVALRAALAAFRQEACAAGGDEEERERAEDDQRERDRGRARVVHLVGDPRQAAVFGRLPGTADPMADLCAMALACHDFARTNPHLYDLMFGLSIHGRYSPSRGGAEPILSGQSASFQAAYAYLRSGCARLVDSRCVRQADPDLIALQFWSTLHGFIMLDLAGHFAQVDNPSSDILVPMCINMVVGLGAKRAQADLSATGAKTMWASAQRGKSRKARSK